MFPGPPHCSAHWRWQCWCLLTLSWFLSGFPHRSTPSSLASQRPPPRLSPIHLLNPSQANHYSINFIFCLLQTGLLIRKGLLISKDNIWLIKIKSVDFQLCFILFYFFTIMKFQEHIFKGKKLNIICFSFMTLLTWESLTQPLQSQDNHL